MSGSFAELLRRHRLSAELTQEALAERAGLSVNGIQKLESGGTRPQRETVRRLIDALQLRDGDLATFQNSAQPPPRQRANSTAQRAAGSLDAPLPAPLTSFVGRDHDRAEVTQLLASARLLTLTGVGGCGKTRLALEVARQHPDAVSLVELAALDEPTLVPQAVASALGVRESSMQPLLTTIVAALRPRRLLLVLDNCEHLLDACAHLANALLTACPDLRILATSRETLGIPGEVSWRVPSLAVPPLGHSVTAEEVGAYEAAQLFVQRARSFSPGFTIGERNAGAIARICNEVDGIPLAVELAAALLRGLSVDDIADRLDQRFKLLTGGSRAALPRQRTLRATIDWSYDLLSDAERALFVRLSIFAGRWLLEAAEHVCAGDGIEREQVLELLLHLVDKSLVVADEDHDGRQRYRLLDTLREYGRERLLAGGGSEAVHRQHARFYLALAERAEPELNQPRQAAWIERLAFEESEMWAALVRLAARGEIQDALRLAAVLGRFWQLRGHLHEGRRRLGSLLALPGAEAPTLARAKVLDAAGALALYQGDMAATRALLGESLMLYRQQRHASGVAWVLFHLGWMSHDHQRERAARRFLREALDLFRVLDDRRGVARALNALGMVAMVEGDLDLACELHRESLDLSRAIGDGWAVAWALTNFATDLNTLAKIGRGDAHAARPLFEESLTIWSELGERRHLAFAQMNLADAAMCEGNFAEARERLEHSIALFTDLEDSQGMYFSVCIGSQLLWDSGQHAEVVRLIAATYGRVKAAGGKMYPMIENPTEEQLTVARTLLGPEGFEAAWTDGSAMSVAGAVQYMRERIVAG
jgi:non-specific serine/threonine protein kinase